MSQSSASTPKSRSVDETETRKLQSEARAGSIVSERGTMIGAMVSRYVVLEEVGRGGMGRVLRAYDPKLQREVALKEVHAHRLDAEATRRLVAEARAMAKLSHPNVVAVYDVEEVGSDGPELPSEASGQSSRGKRAADRLRVGGGVVLVMEYVAGQTLKTWLRAEDTDWRSIVDHFIAAGRGVAAAHEAGLLHRDFKPANVLVLSSRAKRAGGSIDGATVKVTDFGLAKSRGAPSPGASSAGHASNEELTEAGTVLGTPRYMAPEQHDGEPLTPAADQYAFCVALWEALCTEPPFSGETMAQDKVAGPPPWPTSRSAVDPPLASLGSSGRSLRSGAPGASTPRPIAEAIVRGLSPRPDDRWPTMAALLEALAYDPVRRRNRWLLGLGALGGLGLVGASYGAWAEARAQRCSGAQQQLTEIWDETRSARVKAAILGLDKPYAQGVWTRTQRELDTYGSDWTAMHREACEATAVRGEQSPQMMDLRMGCLHQAAQELRATVETLADADEEVVLNAHKLTAGLRPLSRCADTEALAAEVEPPLPEEADAVEAARLELARANSLVRAGRYEAAQGAVQAAKDALVGVEYGPVQTEVALREGHVLERLGRYEEADAALSGGLMLAAQWGQWDAMTFAATKLTYLVGDLRRRMEEGLRYRPLAEGLTRGKPKQEAVVRTNVANVLDSQGRYAEAEAEHRAALSLKEKELGPDHPGVAMSRNNLAASLFAQGKYAEAEAEQRTALSLWEKAVGPDHPDAVLPRYNIANMMYVQGRYAEAEAEQRTVLSLWEKALGPDHPDVGSSRASLAAAIRAQGRYAEAEVEYRAALPVLEKALGPDHPEVATWRNSFAGLLYAQGEYAEAEAEFRAALSLVEKALGPDHPEVAEPRSNLAAVLLKLGRATEALPLAEQAWARRKRDDIPKEERAQTAFVLAEILWTDEGPGRDRIRARQLAGDALRSFREAGEARSDKAAEVQRWLDEHPPSGTGM